MMSFLEFSDLKETCVNYFLPAYGKEWDYEYTDGRTYRIIPDGDFIRDCCFILNSCNMLSKDVFGNGLDSFLETVFDCIEKWYGSLDKFFEIFTSPDNLKDGLYEVVRTDVFDANAVWDAYAYHVNNSKPKKPDGEKAEPKKVGYKAELDNLDGSFDEVAYTETMSREDFYSRLSKKYDMERIRIHEYELAS